MGNPLEGVAIRKGCLVADVVVPRLCLVEVEALGETHLHLLVGLDAGFEVAVEPVEVLLRAGKTEVLVECIALHGKARDASDVGEFLGDHIRRLGRHVRSGGHLARVAEHLELSLELHDVDDGGEEFILRSPLLDFVEHLLCLYVESLVEENLDEVDLLTDFERGRMLHAEHTERNENLFVEVCLEVGELLFCDSWAECEHLCLVVLLQRVEAVEEEQKFRSFVASEPCGVEFEVALFGLAHQLYKVEDTFSLFVFLMHICSFVLLVSCCYAVRRRHLEGLLSS